MKKKSTQGKQTVFEIFVFYLVALPFTLLTLTLFVRNVFAGDHRPLCEKVEVADLVFEMRFKVRGQYHAELIKKEWPPSQTELGKTARTGIITHVFKGDLKVGDAWPQSHLLGFGGPSSVQKWQRFFAMKEFSAIYFLKRVGKSYESTGFAEESAACESNAQWSWCEKYPEFKKAVGKCLFPKGGDESGMPDMSKD